MAFNIYRTCAGGDPVKLNPEPLAATTDFVDPEPGDVSRARYGVRPVLGGEELEPSKQVAVSNPQGRPYITIPLQGDYACQKVGIADLDGMGLWANGLGHCDHAYVGDIDPARPRLEIYYGYETPKVLPAGNGVCLADAATGAILWGIDEPTYHVHSSGLVSDIDPARPGMECYSGEKEHPTRWLHSAIGELLADETAFDPGLNPRAVYWDADPQRELLVGGRIYDYETGHVYLEGIDAHQAPWADVMGVKRSSSRSPGSSASTSPPSRQRTAAYASCKTPSTGSTWPTSPWAMPSRP